MSKIILGVVFAVVALAGLGFLIFVLRSLKTAGGFGNLNGPSKVLAVILSVISLTAIFAGSWFSVKNFTYRPPQATESTKELQSQIKKSNNGVKRYTQLIKTEDYYTASLDELEKTYSKDRRSAVENYSQVTEKSRSFILRNVGRSFKNQEGLFTTELKTVSGEIVKLDKDKNGRVLVFADDSEYSANILSLLYKYNQNHQDKPVAYTIIFPTLDGTKVDAFFAAHNGEIGSMDENSVVTIDSQPNTANQSIYGIATQEYSVTDLPSYVAIDKDGVISLAGVGSLVDSDDKLETWLNSALTSKNKLYNEIQRGIDKDRTKTSETKTSSSNSSSSEAKSEESTATSDQNPDSKPTETESEGGTN